MVEVAIVAALRHPSCRDGAVKTLELPVLHERQLVARHHVPAAPDGRLLLRSSTVFQPHVVDLLPVTLRRGQSEILKSDQYRIAHSNDLAVKQLRRLDEVANGRL